MQLLYLLLLAYVPVEAGAMAAAPGLLGPPMAALPGLLGPRLLFQVSGWLFSLSVCYGATLACRY